MSSDHFDEHDAFLSACKGEPYTVLEWEREVARLREELNIAHRGRRIASERGVCLARRFCGSPLASEEGRAA